MAGKGKGGNVIIRKEEVVGGGHHGGAWKVAYADFVTAMMAFFLLMWLLNATTEEQRKGLADYFSPSNLMSHASSGTGKPFGGHTPFDEGSMASDRGAVNVIVGKRPQVDVDDDPDPEIATESTVHRSGAADGSVARNLSATGQASEAGDRIAGLSQSATMDTLTLSTPDQAALQQVERFARAKAQAAQPEGEDAPPDQAQLPTEGELRAQRERNERAAFGKAAEEIREAVLNDPNMRDLAKQLTIDMTPEGLRIQLLDEERVPMFATASATPNDRAKLLLQKITPVLLRLPEGISISGHTDAAPFSGPGRTNWELSTERANVTRRMLVEQGLPESRIKTVTGHADRDPLLPSDPMAAANRRIAIVVLREAANRTPAIPPKPNAPNLRTK
jgi:chemotaxis protein MotB